ncbi:hypothetical protein GCM10028796_23350 [Ramlibacter monticola]|uniref:Uncharacterized protein n=1 Tax=Ramlibacter monticola TaxID=1926872 RepID=A0A937CV26_9BURK|nr:hypothetical protein [Ramlibacter monticola]MBL0392582.1 hypothetical protein [Ramlibacter monticola]
MTTALPPSLLDRVLGLELGATDPETGNRCLLDGLAWSSAQDGALEFRARRLEATALRLASGPLTLEIGRIAVHKLAGQVRFDDGRPHLGSLVAESAELSGVTVQGPVILPQRSNPAAAGEPASSAWSLGPLAAADGTLRGKIVDAHLLFDADVTVPIRQGAIHFNDATVEHVGPDSRMGVSRMGFYVDAPNGRSYLYQFPTAPVCGVEFERRGALLGPWVTDRGKLQLQAFGEWLLGHALVERGLGMTEQARLLLGRTALSGEVQAGDGRLAAPGVQADLVGRAEGRNAVRIHSEAVGQGLTVEMSALSARDAVLRARGTEVRCGEIAARLTLQLFLEGGQLRSKFTLASMNLTGLRLGGLSPASA